MFCGKCGAKCEDDVLFCETCGARLKDQRIAQDEELVQELPIFEISSPSARARNRRVGILAVAAAVLVLLIALFALFGGRSYKKTVEECMDAIFEADAAAIVALFPDDVIDYALEEAGYSEDEMHEMLEELSTTLQDQRAMLDYYLGKNWSVSYEVGADEDLSPEEIVGLIESYEGLIEIKDAKLVTVELTYQFSGTENNSTMEIPIIKVGRSWYIDFMNIDSIFEI